MALNKNTAGGFTFINRLSSTKLLKYASFRTVSGAIVDWGGGGSGTNMLAVLKERGFFFYGISS